MPTTCQHPECNETSVYPLITQQGGETKRYQFCDTHHKEAKAATVVQNSGAVADRMARLFGEQFRHATFESYNVESDHLQRIFTAYHQAQNGSKKDGGLSQSHVQSLQEAKSDLEAFSRRMVERESGRVLLTGPPGLGKTHLAVATTRTLADHGYVPSVWHGTRILSQVRATYNSSPKEETESIQSMIRRMTSADVLVIEDIRASCFARDMRDYMFDIVDQCYRNQSMLIVTSNFSPVELASPDRLGPHLMDRLLEPPSCTEELTGFSYRQARKAYQKIHHS